MDSKQFREAAHAAVDEIANYYDSLAERPVLPSVSPGYLQPLLPSTPPLTPEPWSAVQHDIATKIMPGLTHWQSPNFMAFFPSISSFPGMLGELYSAAFTAPAFNWICSPAVTELETIVLDWVAQMLKLPECFLSSSKNGGGGVIQGSASEAMVVVMVSARDRYLRQRTAGLEGEEKEQMLNELRGKLVAIGNENSHSCAEKATLIAATKWRTIPCKMEDGLSMRGEAVKKVIEDCKKEGLEPFFLNTMLGTTATCAVDKFDEISQVMQDYPDVWIHVDGAYAGAALVCEEYQHIPQAFSAFNSFDMNMHKWLLTNFDASCLFVKERKHLIDALSITPSYLRNSFSDSGRVTDYRDWQIPLGRRFRALKIWFVIRTYGVEGLRSHIRRTIKLGDIFHALILTRPDLFKVLTPPAFALTVFNVKPSRDTDETTDLKGANEVTEEVYRRVNQDKKIFISHTDISGISSIRVVSANEYAAEPYVREAFEIIVRKAEEVLKDKEQNGKTALSN